MELLSEENRTRKRRKSSSSNDVPTGMTRDESSDAHEPSTSRLYHHLAILSQPNTLKQLFYNSVSLSPAVPFSIPRRLSHFETIIENDHSQGPIAGKYDTEQYENTGRGSRRSMSADEREEGSYDIVLQPEIRPISQEQLVSEVKDIFAGLVMVESKCIETDSINASFASPGPGLELELNDEQWQALIALHRTLLQEHHDLGKVRTTNEDDDISDREIWTGVAREWYHIADTIPDREGETLMQNASSSSYDFESPNNDPESSETSLSSSPQSALPQQDRSTSSNTNASVPYHICTVCNASFRRIYELRKHAKYHSKPIACPNANCTRRFGRRRDLLRHQKAAHKDTHTSEQWFCPHEACRHNDVVFGRRDNLLRHLRNIHSTDVI